MGVEKLFHSVVDRRTTLSFFADVLLLSSLMQVPDWDEVRSLFQLSEYLEAINQREREVLPKPKVIEDLCDDLEPPELLKFNFVPPNKVLPVSSEVAVQRSIVAIRRGNSLYTDLLNRRARKQWKDHGGGRRYQHLKPTHTFIEVINHILRDGQPNVEVIGFETQKTSFPAGQLFLVEEEYDFYLERGKDEVPITNVEEALEIMPNQRYEEEDLREDYRDYEPLAKAMREFKETVDIKSLYDLLNAIKSWIYQTGRFKDERSSFKPYREVFNPLLKTSPEVLGNREYAIAALNFLTHFFPDNFSNPEYLLLHTQGVNGKNSSRSVALLQAKKLSGEISEVSIILDDGSLVRYEAGETDQRAFIMQNSREEALEKLARARGEGVAEIIAIDEYTYAAKGALYLPIIRVPVVSACTGFEDNAFDLLAHMGFKDTRIVNDSKYRLRLIKDWGLVILSGFSIGTLVAAALYKIFKLKEEDVLNDEIKQR